MLIPKSIALVFVFLCVRTEALRHTLNICFDFSEYGRGFSAPASEGGRHMRLVNGPFPHGRYLCCVSSHWGASGSFSCWSVAKSGPALCNPLNCSTQGFPVPHYLPEFAQTHVHWVSDAIQPSHPLSPLSPLALHLSQHQDIFQWVTSLNQMAKVLELQLPHQSFWWIFRVDFL